MQISSRGNSREVNKAVRKAKWEVRQSLSAPQRAEPVASPERVKYSAFLPARDPYCKDGSFDLDSEP